jgi:hypothetical protein
MRIIIIIDLFVPQYLLEFIYELFANYKIQFHDEQGDNLGNTIFNYCCL